MHSPGAAGMPSAPQASTKASSESTSDRRHLRCSRSEIRDLLPSIFSLLLPQECGILPWHGKCSTASMADHRKESLTKLNALLKDARTCMLTSKDLRGNLHS